MQIFVRNLGGRSVAYDVGAECHVGHLQALVEVQEGIPSAHLGFVYARRQLQEECCIADYGISAGSTVHLVLRLRAGKGGFGALLRGQGRDGKVTSNFDAMRDLQGRRIRHSKCEEKLEEWRSHAYDRELERVALKHMKELSKEQRREAKYQVNVDEVAAEQNQAIKKVQAAVQDALATAQASAVSSKRKAADEGSKAAKKSKMLAYLDDIDDFDEED